MPTIKRSILLTLILTACATARVMAQAQVDIIPDVVYGHKDGLALTFDVLKPKANSNGAAVIFMVSAGWRSNYMPPQQAAVRFKDLLDKGFTVITVRHGSSPKYFIPEIVSDVRRAVRFIRYNAKQWGVDPNRMGVFGGSAGGHLSLMLGTASDDGDPNAKEDFMKASDRVASVVAYFPPVDLRPLARGVNPQGAGGAPNRFPALNFEKEKVPDYSPIVHVSSDDPPKLMKEFNIDENRIFLTGHSMGGMGAYFYAAKHPEIWAGVAPIAGGVINDRDAPGEKVKHLPFLVMRGEKDLIVRPEASRASVAKMKELGVKHTYIETPGADHEVWIRHNPTNMARIFEFINGLSKDTPKP